MSLKMTTHLYKKKGNTLDDYLFQRTQTSLDQALNKMVFSFIQHNNNDSNNKSQPFLTPPIILDKLIDLDLINVSSAKATGKHLQHSTSSLK